MIQSESSNKKKENKEQVLLTEQFMGKFHNCGILGHSFERLLFQSESSNKRKSNEKQA
jgi:hypothetical protein